MRQCKGCILCINEKKFVHHHGWTCPQSFSTKFGNLYCNLFCLLMQLLLMDGKTRDHPGLIRKKFNRLAAESPIATLWRLDAKASQHYTLNWRIGSMSNTSTRSTIYFEPDLHRALRLKAAHSRCSLSDLVNDAVRRSLQEDQEDLAAFEERVNEPLISYEDLLKDLKQHGKI